MASKVNTDVIIIFFGTRTLTIFFVMSPHLATFWRLLAGFGRNFYVILGSVMIAFVPNSYCSNP